MCELYILSIIMMESGRDTMKNYQSLNHSVFLITECARCSPSSSLDTEVPNSADIRASLDQTFVTQLREAVSEQRAAYPIIMFWNIVSHIMFRDAR